MNLHWIIYYLGLVSLSAFLAVVSCSKKEANESTGTEAKSAPSNESFLMETEKDVTQTSADKVKGCGYKIAKKASAADKKFVKDEMTDWRNDLLDPTMSYDSIEIAAPIEKESAKYYVVQFSGVESESGLPCYLTAFKLNDGESGVEKFASTYSSYVRSDSAADKRKTEVDFINERIKPATALLTTP